MNKKIKESLLYLQKMTKGKKLSMSEDLIQIRRNEEKKFCQKFNKTKN